MPGLPAFNASEWRSSAAASRRSCSRRTDPTPAGPNLARVVRHERIRATGLTGLESGNWSTTTTGEVAAITPSTAVPPTLMKAGRRCRGCRRSRPYSRDGAARRPAARPAWRSCPSSPPADGVLISFSTCASHGGIGAGVAFVGEDLDAVARRRTAWWRPAPGRPSRRRSRYSRWSSRRAAACT